MGKYKITMAFITHDIYDTYEDEEGHHAGKQVDQYTINNPYYTVVDKETDENLDDFQTYEGAKEYIKELIKEGRY